MHPCEIIYNIAGKEKKYGEMPGICRITGKKSIGLNFEKWVKSTFNDHAYLLPGNIISNEALFCFDEKSELIREITGKEKLQRFRTYSHIIHNNKWYILTKADKKKIFNLILKGPEIVCLTDTGQKHIFFKHKIGFWQLDEIFIKKDLDKFKKLHDAMRSLLKLGFSQGEIISGNYQPERIIFAGLKEWYELENIIKKVRGSPIFIFVSWMLFLTEEEKKVIQEKYNFLKKQKSKNKEQLELCLK